MSKLTDDESYYCLGYANKSVKKEFKSFFRNFPTLEAAIDGLIYLGDNLCNNYSFMDNDVKYKLRAKASSLDNPEKLNEALLRWYSFVESSNYKSMGCVIEKLLMVRKQIVKKYYYQDCGIVVKREQLAKVSNNPDMLDNETKSYFKLDHDVNIIEKDSNLRVVQNSGDVPASASKELSPSIDFHNYESAWSVENKYVRSFSEYFTKDVNALSDSCKREIVDENADKSNGEGALYVDEVVLADNFIKNTSVLNTSNDLNISQVLSNSTEVLDDSVVKLISQQLECIHVEPVGENDVSVVRSKIGNVPKLSGTKSFSDELKLQKLAEKAECEESDRWGTIVEISSDSEFSSDYDHCDNCY